MTAPSCWAVRKANFAKGVPEGKKTNSCKLLLLLLMMMIMKSNMIMMLPRLGVFTLLEAKLEQEA